MMADKQEAARMFQAATEAKDTLLSETADRPISSKDAYEAFKRKYPQEWEAKKEPPKRQTSSFSPSTQPDSATLFQKIYWYLVGIGGILATISMQDVPIRHQLKDQWIDQEEVILVGKKKRPRH